MIAGFGQGGSPRHLLQALSRTDVTDLHTISDDLGVTEYGYDMTITPLIRNKQISSAKCCFIGQNPLASQQYIDGTLDVEFIPIGTMVERIRAGGAGIGGFYTRTGVGTIVEEGKETKIINGEKYLLELPLHADVALIHAWKADTFGNVVYRRTSRNFNEAFATAAEPDEPAADPIVNYQLVGQTGDIIKTDIIDKDAYQTSDYTVDPDGTATVTDPQTGDNMVIEVNKVEEPDQPTLEIPDDIQVLPEPNNTAHTDEALALAWPVVGNISATFGNRTHPITKEVITHDHIDIIAAEGTDILSAYDGTVIQAEFAADKGYYIVIQHAKGHCTAYGHCSELIAKVGDNVKKGDVIAKVGSTGQSTGAHLAFWVLVYGTAQDPLNFLP